MVVGLMMGEGGGFSEGPLTITEVTVKRSHGGGLFDEGWRLL